MNFLVKNENIVRCNVHHFILWLVSMITNFNRFVLYRLPWLVLWSMTSLVSLCDYLRQNSHVNEDDRKCWLVWVHPRHDLLWPPMYVLRNLEPIFDSHSEYIHFKQGRISQDERWFRYCYFFSPSNSVARVGMMVAVFSFRWYQFGSLLLPFSSRLWWCTWLWCCWCFWQDRRNHWRGERISCEHAWDLPQQGVMSHTVARCRARPLEWVARKQHVSYQRFNRSFPHKSDEKQLFYHRSGNCP